MFSNQLHHQINAGSQAGNQIVFGKKKLSDGRVIAAAHARAGGIYSVRFAVTLQVVDASFIWIYTSAQLLNGPKSE